DRVGESDAQGKVLPRDPELVSRAEVVRLRATHGEESADVELGASQVRADEDVIALLEEPESEIDVLSGVEERRIVAARRLEGARAEEHRALAEDRRIKKAPFSFLDGEGIPPVLGERFARRLLRADDERESADARKLLEERHGLLDDSLVRNDDVVVEGEDELALRQAIAVVARRGGGVLGAPDEPDALAKFRLDHVRRAIGRSVVDDDDLELRPVELERARDRPSQEVLLVEVDNDDADDRLVLGHCALAKSLKRSRRRTLRLWPVYRIFSYSASRRRSRPRPVGRELASEPNPSLATRPEDL